MSRIHAAPGSSWGTVLARRAAVCALATMALALAAPAGCKKRRGTSPCSQAVSYDQCQQCCGAAGRSGGTWVDDDCVCHDP